jgi:NADP-dependent 3-hydroxy acid dehydrogenase YdfG
VLIFFVLQGLGRALVQALYEQNAVIYGLGRNSEHLKTLQKDFPKVQILSVDLSNWNETRAAVAKIGQLDFLVNNAGVGPASPFLNLDSAAFDEYVKVFALLNIFLSL